MNTRVNATTTKGCSMAKAMSFLIMGDLLDDFGWGTPSRFDAY
jgi:hypothetical protein